MHKTNSCSIRAALPLTNEDIALFFSNMSTFRTIKPVSFREGDKKRLIPQKTHLYNEEQKAMVLI